MLSCRIVRASARQTALVASRRLTPVMQQRTFMPESLNNDKLMESKFPTPVQLTEEEDPLQNGAFVQPAVPVKRQFRDPYGDWWDKQERRNYNEPVHEDQDLLGMFSPYEYTWTTTGKGLAQIGAFVAVFMSVVYAVKATYPDRPTVPRTFEGGLLRELGGAGAVPARSPEDAEAEEAEL